MRISYPNAADIECARKAGVDPGSEIMIHGLPNGEGKSLQVRRTAEWTMGCIAVRDEEMDKIWRLVPDGTAIEINP